MSDQEMKEKKENENVKETSSAKKYGLLVVAIIMDGIGLLSYSFPGFGETIDVVWAPIAALANYLLYGGVLGTVGGLITLIEEIIPGTDFIPTFLIVWCCKYIPVFQKLLNKIELFRGKKGDKKN